MRNPTVAQILQVAEEHLQTAQFGLDDMRARPERAQSGLRNAVVFGRAITFALQNLRSIIADFDAWYLPRQQAMREDQLMRFFHELRTQIEKTAQQQTAVSAFISSFSTSDLARFRPAPPNAKNFFIGDQNGSSGWEVLNSDGTSQKYYIDLPPDIGKATIHLIEAPEPFKGQDAQDLIALYLDKLGALLKDARLEFLPKT